MSVTDKIGNEIEVGSYIIYSSVGTIGEVLDIKTDENGSWVLIAVDELTKLWYNTKYIELTDKKYVKTSTNDKDDKELSVDEIKEHLKHTVSSEMSSDAVGGG
ncbi:DUF2098 family protein [Methanosphaera sp.]|uniref:DUF2098 family protein n=1 Tax=Methanosphaera sp. TaxID=2666342 RepID=UPI0025EA124A|nr:DUF2098 family protein [Methanosphaera sp.]MEE1118118.1 DUF2098 family protein [Methanosphaera sp.]MEE3324701.1 DUF2098 family protein [Methanosphaera sp.]MEE3418689.1 DUF2098 family protein [Methanosphaera sp.]